MQSSIDAVEAAIRDTLLGEDEKRLSSTNELYPPAASSNCVGPYENVFHGVKVQLLLLYNQGLLGLRYDAILDPRWVAASVPGWTTEQVSNFEFRQHAITINLWEVECREQIRRQADFGFLSLERGHHYVMQHKSGRKIVPNCASSGVIILDAMQREEHIDAEPSDTIEEVKQKYCGKKGIPVEQQRYSFGEHNLANYRTLADYNIGTGIGWSGVIHMELRCPSCRDQFLLFPHPKDWDPYQMKFEDVLNDRADQLFDASTSKEANCGCAARKLRLRSFLNRPLDEVHWYLRCASPSRNVLWSPDNDRYWPMRFRKNIRYLTKISLKGKQVDRIPVDVVAIIGKFL